MYGNRLHNRDEVTLVLRKEGAGPVTAADVAAVLTWTRRETALADLEPFARMLAVLETDAHLEVLAAQGRVRRDLDGDHDGGVDGDDAGVARHRTV